MVVTPAGKGGHWQFRSDFGRKGVFLELKVSGRNTDLTDALTRYAQEKFQKLDKFFDGIGRADAILRVEHDTQIAELVVSVQGGKDLVAEARDDDMYAAIDLVAEKMQRQLKKHKAKLRDKRGRHSGRSPSSEL